MSYSHIQVVVMRPPCERLAWWLSRNGLDWRPGSKEYGYELARNQSITRFLREDVPRGKTHLLMLDGDMVPIRETRHILRGDDPLVYCGFSGKHGSRGHRGDGDFGWACSRISADMLTRIGYPWSETTIVRCTRRECECGFFRRRALAIGVKPRMVGLIGHEQTCIEIPCDEPPGYKLLWEEDLPEL